MHAKAVFAQLREHEHGLYTEVELLPPACVDRTVVRVSLLIHTQCQPVGVDTPHLAQGRW